MRVLQVTPYFYPAWAYGGIPRVVYELTTELARQRIEVTVLTTDVLDSQNRISPRAFPSTDLKGVRTWHFKNVSNYLSYHHQLYLPMGLNTWLQNNIAGYDIIHLHAHRHFLNNITHRHAVKKGIPYILSAHGTAPRIERKQKMKKLFDLFWGDAILRDALGVIAVSEKEIAQYVEMGVDRSKVSLIYNGIDFTAFEHLPEKGTFRERYSLGKKRIVLFLGKITPRKGIDNLLRSLARIPEEDVALVIAGNDMGFASELRKIIRDLALQDRVLFTGLLTGSDKLSAYRDADVVVYPSIHEIFGLVPLEAIMCGTPVIVADDCGCGEIIRKRGAGYIVKYGDIEDLAQKIEWVLEHKSEAAESVGRGRKFIIQELNWPKIAAQVIETYQMKTVAPR